MQSEVKPPSEWVRIQTERPLLQKYNDQVGEVVGRLRITKGAYTHVIVRFADHSQYFSPSELVPVKSPHQQLNSPEQTHFTPQTSVLGNSNIPRSQTGDSSQKIINLIPNNMMNEQSKAAADQNRAANEVLADRIETSLLSQDSDGDGLTNRSEASLGNDPESADSDSDGVNDLQEVLLGTNPNNLDPNSESITNSNELLSTVAPNKIEQTEEPLQQNESKQSQVQDPSTPSLNAESEELQGKPQLPDPKPDSLNKNTSETEQPTFINVLYQRLQERSNLDLSNATVLVQEGTDALYRGTFQASELNVLTPEYQGLFQKALDDPSGLKGELTIDVNGKTIFHVEDGQLKVDEYKLAGKQQIAEAQPYNESQAALQPNPSRSLDASTAHSRYYQEVQEDSLAPAEQPSIDVYEHIAQKALNDGLSLEQAKQVLMQDPFHQTLTLSIGEKQADRFTEHLLNSLGSQAKTSNRVTALENRVENLESFNKHLSTQLETLNQKLDRLSQSKAFRSKSPGLNQFLGNVKEFASNTWQATKNALRQKAGEVSMFVVSALAKTSTQWFGEPVKDNLRVIDASNGQRLGINREGKISIAKAPTIKAASEYQRLSQGIDSKLPPSAQAKQIAMTALKERFTPTQIHSILSHSPKFQEITKAQGANKANQFTSVAIAAAQRQNAVDAQPKKERQAQKQNQHQA